MSDFHSPEDAHYGDEARTARHEIIERLAPQQVYNRRTKKITPVVVQYRACGCVTWEHADD